MANILNTTQVYNAADVVTHTNLNQIISGATFVTGTGGTTDNVTLEVDGTSGSLQVKDGGIDQDKLSTGHPRWDSTNGRLYVDGMLDGNNFTTAGISINSNLVGDKGYAFIDLNGDSTGTSEYVRLLNSSGNCSLENKKPGKGIKLTTTHTNGTTNYNALVVGSQGAIGIGTSSPDKPITVVTTNSTPLKLSRTSTSNENVAILFHNGVGTTDWYAGKAGGNGFGIGNSADLNGNALFRIQNSGTVLVGGLDTSPYNNTTGSTGSGNTALAPDGAIYSGRYQNVPIAINSYGWTASSTYRDLQHFYVNGVIRGKLEGNTDNQVRLINHSDYRLKEDVIDIESSIEKTKQLNPVNFAWKESGNRVDGFIAHELQEVCPDAVSGTKDEVDDEGNPEYQGIDQSKIIPLLTKALQESITKIETLEARIESLENS